MKFYFTLVDPLRLVYGGNVESVSLPGTGGEFSVLAHHTHIVARLIPGEITVKKSDESGDVNIQRFRMSGGMAEMSREGRLTVFISEALTVGSEEASSR